MHGYAIYLLILTVICSWICDRVLKKHLTIQGLLWNHLHYSILHVKLNKQYGKRAYDCTIKYNISLCGCVYTIGILKDYVRTLCWCRILCTESLHALVLQLRFVCVYDIVCCLCAHCFYQSCISNLTGVCEGPAGGIKHHHLPRAHRHPQLTWKTHTHTHTFSIHLNGYLSTLYHKPHLQLPKLSFSAD